MDRVKTEKTFESGGSWQLDQLRSYFAPDIQNKIDAFRHESDLFYSHYGKYEQSVATLNNYLMLLQFDPITTCNRPPAQVKVRQTQRTAGECEFHIIYNIFGTRDYYNRDVIVKLRFVKGVWLIADVRYMGPTFGAPLNGVRSMGASLEFMTKELRTSFNWAARHRDELFPNGTIHAGRGPFDRP